MLMRRANSSVQSDGHIMQPSKDPPGQRCVYITPGDLESEVYRLTTYKRFPNHVPIDYMHLAEIGFYFTGFKDRVKCFGCGRTVEEWQISDNPRSSEWHSDDCEMATGIRERNVPITRLLRRKPNISPQSTRRTSSPQSNANTSLNEAPTISRNYTSTARTNGSDASRVLFPCHNPANPHMRSVASREQTFAGNNNWPGDRIRATPRQIAEAGMFYLGSRDRVKCWYCNGGLQNWEESDDPWFEHAKWYPECEFVLQNKGSEFVENVCGRYPSLQRPSVPQRTNSSNAAPQIIDPRPPNNVTAPANSSAANNTTAATDPKEELTRLEKSKVCKGCFNEPATVLLLPCGHLSACSDCSKSLTNCPVCKCKIKETFRTYMS